MIQKEIFCGGRFITTQETLEITAPYSGEPQAQTYLASVRELEDAITAGLKVMKMLKDLPSFRKADSLLFIAGRLQKERDDFARIICLEAAKPWKYAVAEVDRAIRVFLVAADECKRLPREYLDLEWTPAGEGREGLVKYFPAGLVAGISPFNFPLNLAVHKIAPAIAAGCPIILKPSSRTPLATLELARIIHDSGLPEGAVSILPMNRVTGNLLVTDDRISLLSFTGSPEVGWKMKASAGKKKVVLELGGNAGVIVARTADPGIAVQKCLTGAFAYSGQVCIHAQRIYVHRSLFDQFTGDFISRAKLLKRGDPLSPDTDISVMISEEEAVRVEAWVNDAVHHGARILTGGNREGSFFQPTALTGTHPDMNVCSCEIFGPVVTLEPYGDIEEAVNRVNEGRFGLQAGVFTNDIREMDYAFSHLEVGGVIINDVPTFRVDHMPYGGVKDSGLGREGVKYAIFDMLEPRLLVKNF